MRYLGGKTRQAAWLAAEVAARRGTRSKYLEPFIGGGSVAAAIAPAFAEATLSDFVPDLVELWRAVIGGWVPPAVVSREEWESLRAAAPSAMRAWAGYAASYNGKWFAGYGPTASGRDYLAESQRGIVKKVAGLGHAHVVCCDYAEHQPDVGTVAYCDPPYASTEAYAAADDFDHRRFWQTMDAWVNAGALVMVTEYTAPAHWCPVSSVRRPSTLSHSTAAKVDRETLFVRFDQIMEAS